MKFLGTVNHWIRYNPYNIHPIASIRTYRLAKTEYDKVPDAENEVARLRKFMKVIR